MGTMKIIGKAERKYTCDRMTISIHVINCRYFLPTDLYLVYDDKSIYQKVLQALKIYDV